MHARVRAIGKYVWLQNGHLQGFRMAPHFFPPPRCHYLPGVYKLCMNLYSITIFSSSCHRNFPFAHEWERQSLRTHAVCNDKCIYFFFCEYPTDCDFGHTQKCFTIAGSECQKRILSIQSTISHHNTSYKCKI